MGEMAFALAGAFGSSGGSGSSCSSGGIEPVVTGEYRLGDVRHIVASPEGAARTSASGPETPFVAGMTEFASAPLREPALAQV